MPLFCFVAKEKDCKQTPARVYLQSKVNLFFAIHPDSDGS